MATRSSTRTAFLFPGQASQTPGMRDLVEAVRPDLIEMAGDIVGADPFTRVDDGTNFAQPAIFCASIAGLGTLEERPDVVAGHSMGEIAALVAAGSLSELDGLRLVALRGELMQRAGEERGDGGMLAVLGSGETDVADLAERHGVTVANDNAPGQLALSGDSAALKLLSDDARSAGYKTIVLGVAGAFHSPFMAPAVATFAREVEATVVSPPRVDVFSCVTASRLVTPSAIRARLVDGITSPVRWRQTLIALSDDGVGRFVETGPGRVLSRLVARTLPDAEATTAEAEVGAGV